MNRRFRAVLGDCAEGQPSGGGPDSTPTREQLARTGWCRTLGDAQIAGECLNREACCLDLFVQVEEEPWPSA